MNVIPHLEVFSDFKENWKTDFESPTPQKMKKVKPLWTKTSSVSVSSTDVMAPKGKGRAQCDFPITKGAVWFKLLGLSTTNQDSYRGIPHDSEFIF